MRARRMALHLSIRETLERQHADEPREEGERRARHALGAEAWDKAATYLRQAAQRTMARSSYGAAAGLLREALRALERLPEPPDTPAQALDTRPRLPLPPPPPPPSPTLLPVTPQ